MGGNFGITKEIAESFTTEDESKNDTKETVETIDANAKPTEEVKTETEKEEVVEKKDNEEEKPTEEAKPTEDNKPTEEAKTENVIAEISEDQVKKYFADKGRVIEKVDDLFQEKTKEVNPYENISEDLKGVLKYHQETGRGLNDYLKLQENIDAIPVEKLAIQFAKHETGMDLSNEDAIAYIESELGIDLSDLEDLTATDKIKLNKYVKNYRAELKADQEKYKLPEQKEVITNNQNVEMVTLQDGQQIAKSVYDKHLAERESYIENLKNSVNSVAKTSLNYKFDDNGKEEIRKVEYEPSKEDEAEAVSLATDVDKTVAELFRSDKGFDFAGFKKAMWRIKPANWEKEVTAIVNKALADHTERLAKEQNNVNFDTNRIISENKKDQKKDIFQEPQRFGVQFNI